ncbi:MAG: hypothetical protein HXX20_23365 [Chloroflexi bacterium]|nr:hypothetical protein [Chloroflexota bacterium]
MSAILENILKELEALTAEESLILLTRLSQHLQHSLKGTVGATEARPVQEPLDWQSVSAEEIIASLKASQVEREHDSQ